MGKTRLAGELLAALARARPCSRGAGRPQPALRRRDRVLGARRDPARRPPGRRRTPARPRSTTRSRCASAAVDPERRAEAVAHAGRDRHGRGERRRTTPGALRLAWRRLLASIAAERPLVIAIDDAHWADEEFLELIEDSAATLNDLPILFLCTARPSLWRSRPEFAEDGHPGGARAAPDEDAAIELAATLSRTAPTPDVADRSPRHERRQPVLRRGDRPFGRGGNGDTAPAAGHGPDRDRLPARRACPPRRRPCSSTPRSWATGSEPRALAALLDAEPDAELASLAARSLVRDRSSEDPGCSASTTSSSATSPTSRCPAPDRTRLHERAAAGIGPGRGRAPPGAGRGDRVPPDAGGRAGAGASSADGRRMRRRARRAPWRAPRRSAARAGTPRAGRPIAPRVEERSTRSRMRPTSR